MYSQDQYKIEKMPQKYFEQKFYKFAYCKRRICQGSGESNHARIGLAFTTVIIIFALNVPGTPNMLYWLNKN